jgi:hypothetical protein
MLEKVHQLRPQLEQELVVRKLLSFLDRFTYQGLDICSHTVYTVGAIQVISKKFRR